MGKTHRQMFSIAQGAAAQETLRESQARTEATEATRAELTSLLGTDAQVAGQLGGGGDPALQPYVGRYQIDSEYFSDAKAALAYSGQWVGRGEQSGNFQKYATDANALMAQAEDAAAAGDFQRAEEMRLAAEKLISSTGRWAQKGFNLISDPGKLATQLASSPQAITVGGLLKQGREFLDPSSETSMRYKQALTEGAMRSIDAGARGAHRAARDFGLQAGVARRPFHATQVAAATEAQFSAQRAQVANQAALQFETFSREFAQNSVKFAQAWVAGESYVRDQFSTALSSVYESLAALEMDFLKTSVSLDLESEKQEAQVKQWKWDRISENILRANEAGASMIGTMAGMGAMGGGG